MLDGPKHPSQIKLLDLEQEHIEKVGQILELLHVKEELLPEHTLSYLVDLWIAERQKGEKANKEALEGIEAIVLSAQAQGQRQAGGGAKSAGKHFIRHNIGKMAEGIQKTAKSAQESYEKYMAGRTRKKIGSGKITGGYQREAAIREAENLLHRAEMAEIKNKSDIKAAYRKCMQAEKIFLQLKEYRLAEKALDTVGIIVYKVWGWRDKHINDSFMRLGISRKFAELAKIHAEKKDYEKGAGLLEKSAEFAPFSLYENAFLDILTSVFRFHSRATDRAARAYEKMGQYEKVGDLYADNSGRKAAMAYAKAGLHEKSAKIYEDDFKYLKAARQYELAGNYLGAGRCYQEHLRHIDTPPKLLVALGLLFASSGALTVLAAEGVVDPNGPAAWGAIAGMMLGTYAFLDVMSIKEKYSIVKKTYFPAYAKKMADKAVESFDRQISLCEKSGNVPKLLESYSEIDKILENEGSWTTRFQSYRGAISEIEREKIRSRNLERCHAYVSKSINEIRLDKWGKEDLKRLSGISEKIFQKYGGEHGVYDALNNLIGLAKNGRFEPSAMLTMLEQIAEKNPNYRISGSFDRINSIISSENYDGKIVLESIRQIAEKSRGNTDNALTHLSIMMEKTEPAQGAQLRGILAAANSNANNPDSLYQILGVIVDKFGASSQMPMAHIESVRGINEKSTPEASWRVQDSAAKIITARSNDMDDIIDQIMDADLLLAAFGAENPSENVKALPIEKREAARRLYNLANNTGGFTEIADTIPEAIKNTELTARTMAFTAFKTQSILRQMSERSHKPVVAAYVLSTGFGLRAPTPSMRQFDIQYAKDRKLLNDAYKGVFGRQPGNIPPARKISELKIEFLRQAKTNSPDIDRTPDGRAKRAQAWLHTASRWMDNGWLGSFIYQTAYKVASGGGGISGTIGGDITERIAGVCRKSGATLAIVDHSTVRTNNHPTVSSISIPNSSMGRAIAQIMFHAKRKWKTAKIGWLTVNNNWSVGDVCSERTNIVGINLYAGVEYESSGAARKTLWLPIDDRPFFLGRSWETDNRSARSRIVTKFMDENYELQMLDSTKDYWKAFEGRYRNLESANLMEWATQYRGRIALFDMDGTVIRTKHEIFEKSLAHALEYLSGKLSENGKKISTQELRKKYEIVRHESRQDLYDFGRYRDMELRLYNLLLEIAPKISDESVVATLRVYAKEAYDIYWNERQKGTEVIPEAIRTIEELNARGYKVIIMSDRRDSELYDVLQTKVAALDGSEKSIRDFVLGAIITNNLLSEIEVDLPICRLGLPKENEAFRIVAQALNPAVMVGDSRSHDIRPAENNGIRAVLVKDGAGYEKILEAIQKE